MPKYEFQVEAHAQFEAEQSTPKQGLYRFSYTITVTNTGEVAAQLIGRHWLITDGMGVQQEVHGLGVVGRQPLLRPGESFAYSSACELSTPTGHMEGRYLCVTDDAQTFESPIAPFVLQMPSSDTPSTDADFPTPPSRTLH